MGVAATQSEILKNERAAVEDARRYSHDVLGRSDTRYAQMVPLLPSGARVLDYGCGLAPLAPVLAEAGNTVTAIDLDANAVRVAQQTWADLPQIDIRHGNITDLPDAAFDFVISTQVIEHVHNPGIYLSEINRVLDDGGQLLISTPNVAVPRFVLPLLARDIQPKLAAASERILSDYEKGRDHIQSWDPLHFTHLLASVGFRFEAFVGTEGVPMPNRPRWLPKYIYLKRLRNMSYTMIFLCRKVRQVRIAPHD